MMSQNAILLIGAGGHARACIDVIEQEQRWTVAGLIGLQQEIGTKVLDYSVLGSDADLSMWLGQCPRAMITLGQIKTPQLRIKYFNRLLSSGCELPVIISPHAYVSPHAKIGPGTIVMHGAIVNANAIVGANCIINTHALIEHDASIGNHCHIATAAVINGGVQIGEGTFIGSNTSVRQDIHIGAGSMIGMGQRIISHCVEGTTLPVIKMHINH